MTLYEKLSILVGIVNFTLVGIALLFYYRQATEAQKQTKLLNSSLERSTYIDFESSLFELSKIIIQYPNARPYLYDNKPYPKVTDNDFNLVASFCVFYLDFFDHVLTMEKLSPGGTRWTNKKWETWIYDLLRASPSLRQVLNEEKDWYDENLIKILERAEAGLNIRRSTPSN